MASEIELKLALAPSGPDTLPRHPSLATLEPQVSQLGNTYYDTPEGALEAARSALRLRRDGQHLLQTVKTRGHGGGGLSSRGEWEWPISGPGLDIAGLAEIPPMAALGEATLARLEPRFSTDFTRRTWRLTSARADIEVALDCGEIRAGDARVTIRELELELKDGEPSALQALARDLAAGVALRPSDTSKAARGGALLLGRWTLPEGGSPAAWFHRATVALDALADSHDPAWRHQAREAFQQLACLSDDTAKSARWLADALESPDWFDAAFGGHALALARRLSGDAQLG
ncbi:CYTH domain-containing protein [Halomonas almeriensis]|uniref:CYTH domain-containing protein n=1 Tax=Halomonas almeriensis TaxID=308163 RepID=UPI0025B390DB|nr:CYTH domain-containing protein [Halomonas almeriensis]MDN3552092.1 CYTH domain-containing protein [Halomonas almeriensis]